MATTGITAVMDDSVELFELEDDEDDCGGGSSPPCFADWLNVHDVDASSSENNLRSYRDVDVNFLMEDTEALLKGEMEKLSIDERELVYHDLHGLSSPPKEDIGVLDGLLVDMEVEISLITEKGAYLKAESISPEYVKDRKLRLMFLRADSYDACKAAHRLIAWFEMKKDLFGLEFLCSEITQDDLTDDGRESLHGGYLQILPSRDKYGRIVVMDMLRWYDESIISTPGMLQMFFYIAMVMLQNEDSQRSGAVCIFLGHRWRLKQAASQRELHWKGSKMTGILPVRFCGFHLCCDARTSIRPLLNILQLGMPRDIRHRFQLHVGSETECLYSLMGYGIPVHLMPVTDQGELAVKNHSIWVKHWKEWEQRRPRVSDAKISPTVGAEDNDDDDDESIILPSPHDVLCGRGRPFQDHCGNRYLRQVITEKYDEFNSAGRPQKTCLTESIVYLIQERGGRFLKKDAKDPTKWVEVEFADAREKVAHGFRKHRNAAICPKAKQKSGEKQGWKTSSVVSVHADLKPCTIAYQSEHRNVSSFDETVNRKDYVVRRADLCTSLSGYCTR